MNFHPAYGCLKKLNLLFQDYYNTNIIINNFVFYLCKFKDFFLNILNSVIWFFPPQRPPFMPPPMGNMPPPPGMIFPPGMPPAPGAANLTSDEIWVENNTTEGKVLSSFI